MSLRPDEDNHRRGSRGVRRRRRPPDRGVATTQPDQVQQRVGQAIQSTVAVAASSWLSSRAWDVAARRDRVRKSFVITCRRTQKNDKCDGCILGRGGSRDGPAGDQANQGPPSVCFPTPHLWAWNAKGSVLGLCPRMETFTPNSGSLAARSRLDRRPSRCSYPRERRSGGVPQECVLLAIGTTEAGMGGLLLTQQSSATAIDMSGALLVVARKA